MSPTLAGFLQFIRSVMGISTDVLPDDAGVIQFAYQVALDLVNPQLLAARSSSPNYPTVYALAVYNLGGDNLLNYAMDAPDAPVYKTDKDGNSFGFFAYMRQQFNINGFVGGVVQSTSDVTTSQSMVVPEQMKNLTFANLQNLKTPYGRTYLGFAQAIGTNWGIS